MRYLLCCLMLGLTFLKYGSTTVTDLASKKIPKAAVSPLLRDGLYTLINGTQGCPASIDWVEQCSGFVLNPRANSGDLLSTVRFCRINGGSIVTHNELGKTLQKSIMKNNYVQSIEKNLFAHESIIKSEDTVILDINKRQFQWEHSQSGKGFSCLYSK